MKKIFLFLVLMLFSFSLTHGEEQKEVESAPISLADLDGEPSSIINQSVSVITGSFSDVQTDLVLPGPEPLLLQRAYSSTKPRKTGLLQAGWEINDFSRVCVLPEEEKEEYWQATQIDSFGAERVYRGKKRSSKKKISKMHIRPKVLAYGATNCGAGEISGRTNLRNYRMNYREKGQTVYATNGAGDERYYRQQGSWGGKKLLEWKHPNGLKTDYTWKNCYPESATLIGEDETTLSHFKLSRLDNEQIEKSRTVSVAACDGREVTYKFFKKNGIHKYTNIYYFLREVDRPNAPNEKYTYEKDWYRVGKKERPEGRFMEIDYYHRGKNKINGKIVKVQYYDEPLHGRVKRLKAPVGCDDESIITHSFKYNLKERSNGAIQGCTTVYDAYAHPTKYHFDKHSHLRKIEKFDDDRKLYSSERLFWGAEDRENVTNLVTRAFYDAEDTVIFCRNYTYDKFGNVLCDRFYGNLSGEQEAAATVRKDGTVEGEGAEVFFKTYTYNDRHLVTNEEEGARKITYEYEGSFLTSKTLWDEDKVVSREFYAYDGNGIMIEKVCDAGFDGSETHIERVTPTTCYPYGLPEIVETLCLEEGREVLLKREVNHFNTLGQMLQKDHYDSNGDYVASEYWQYDPMGNVTLAIDKLGQITEKEYDANGNLVYEQGPCRDFCKRYAYDFSNRLIREEQIHTNGNHFIVSHSYDYLGNRIATTDAYGNKTEFTYDKFGRQTSSKSPLVLDEEGNPYHPITTNEYDHMGNIIRQVDSRGNEKKISYNIRGKPILTEYPDGSSEKVVYNLDGTAKRSTSRNGTYTDYTYDIQKRVTKESVYSAEGKLLTEATKEYDPFHLIAEVDGNGVRKTYCYDAAGRLIEVCKGESRVNYTYDSLGRISEEVTLDGGVKRYEYDALDRVVAESEGIDDRITRTTYDALGNKKEIITGDSVTTTLYNSYGQLIETVDALGNRTVTHYDYGYVNELGQNVAYCEVIDSQCNVTVKIFDALGREVEVLRKNPLGEVTQKRVSYYDGADNRVCLIETVITPEKADREVITRWTYDHENRQTSVTESWGTPEEKKTSITYNPVGEKECIIKPDGTEIYHTYDAFGRLERLASSDGSIDYSYTYDKNSNPLKMVDNLTGSVTTRTYDAHNRMISETLGNGLTLRFEYDANGRPTEVILPDQTAIVYGYEGVDLASVKRVKNGEEQYEHKYTQFDSSGLLLESESPIGKFSFSYDLNGRVKTVHSPFWNLNSIEYDSEGNLLSQHIIDSIGETKNGFSYDDLYQLKSESGAFTHSYTHDSLYNRVEKDDNGYLLNSLNQLLDDGVHTYTYDKNGCLVKKNAMLYTYDALNRLTKVKDVSYTYDSENRRLTKTVGNRTIRYLYHDKNEIGSCDENGKIIELRLLGNGKGAEIGAAIAFEFDDVPYFPIHDQNGNVACIVDQEGNIAESYRYSAFGEEQIFGTDTPRNPWRFASKRFDDETGTVFFGRRHYDPSTARWITPDPMGLSAGPNLYAYVNNAPLTNCDLYGLFLSTLFNFVGQTLHFIGDNMAPLPVIGYSLALTGHTIIMGTTKDFTHSSRYRSSSSESLNRPEADPLVRNITVNGIMTRFTEAKNNAEEISDMFGGWNFHFCHNATHGFLSDIFECIAQIFGIPTNSDRQLTKLIREQIAEMGGVNGGGNVNIYAHSQGGLVLYRAMKNLSPEERKMLNVTTLGSAKMISSEGLAGAVNYVSSWDGVPRFDPVGMLKGAFGSSDMNIQRLSSFTYPFGDHFLHHENYWGVLENNGRNFINQYGYCK